MEREGTSRRQRGFWCWRWSAVQHRFRHDLFEDMVDLHSEPPSRHSRPFGYSEQMSEGPGEITQLLQLVPEDSAAGDRLWKTVYPELRRRAGAAFRSEASDHTLTPTGVVHEVFIRLSNDSPEEWKSRASNPNFTLRSRRKKGGKKQADK